MSMTSLLIVSCATSSMGLADSNRLQKGMTSAMVQEVLSVEPKQTVTFKVPQGSNNTIIAMVFDMSVGHTSSGFWTLFVGKPKSDYFAVFENDVLLYWGHPYEFNRHPDPRLNEIGKLAVEMTK
ncbi:MAG: hypothetical protein H7X70_03160 [Candidatus Kapabacteria bacterium]|nr:hypothetical protein [Candidatus Kapabacteria bacterium]